MAQLRTHYQVLGLRRTAGADQIKRSYRDLMRKVHPDHLIGQRVILRDDPEALARLEVEIAQAEYETRLINEAYEILSNPKKRASYDGIDPMQIVLETVPIWRTVRAPDPVTYPGLYVLLLALIGLILFRGVLFTGANTAQVNLNASVSEVNGVSLSAKDAERAASTGDYALAVDLYTTALNSEPSAALYHARGSVNLALDAGFSAALRDFNAALTLNPDHLDALRDRGLLLAERWQASGDVDTAIKAVADLDRYLELGGDANPVLIDTLTALRTATDF